MMPDMNADANRLARLWDELVAGKYPPDDVDAEFLSAINQFEQLAYVPPAAPEIVARSWEKLIEGVGQLVPYELDAAMLKPTNGHHTAHPASVAVIGNVRGRFETLAAFYRIVAIAVIAGFVGGFLTGGWTRIAMRIAGTLTSDRNHGLLTENDAAVGQLTLGGTLTIAFTGAAFGILAAMIYIAVRRWIPGSRRQQPFIFSLLLLGVFGFVVMDPTNPDYVTFGPPWLNVLTFSLGYIVIGTVVGTLVEAFDRRIPALSDFTGATWLHGLKIGALFPCFLLGIFGIGALGFASSEIGPLLILVIFVAAILCLIAPHIGKLRGFQLSKSPVIGYAMFAAPSLIGLTLTLRAIAMILGG
jgi:hypothetical protein